LVPLHVSHLCCVAVRRLARLPYATPSRTRRRRLQEPSGSRAIRQSTQAKFGTIKTAAGANSARLARDRRVRYGRETSPIHGTSSRVEREQQSRSHFGKDADEGDPAALGGVCGEAIFRLKAIGWKGKLWAKRSGINPIEDRAHQLSTFHYILRHQNEGAWTWDFREHPDT